MAKLPPERILKALSSGVMAFFALHLTADERGALAEHISSVPWSGEDGSVNQENIVSCSKDAPITSNALQQPPWSGW